jgi:capsule polysaccharide export protein KpsE/RkpR
MNVIEILNLQRNSSEQPNNDKCVWLFETFVVVVVVVVVVCFSGFAAQRVLSRDFVITHSDAPQSVGLLRTSDKLVAETST